MSAETARTAAPLPLPARRMLPVLALLSAVAPLATDMYLPAFPQLSQVFGAQATQVQFTLTAFLLGLALGQLLIGPLSDGWGRRRPLLAGTVVCFLSTLACVAATDIHWLTAARFVQGLSGAAGVVLARAIIADSAQGPALAKTMGLMMMIGGVAPVTAPAIGSLLLTVGDWRWVFMTLAALMVLMFLGAVRWVPETLPPPARHVGGLRSLARGGGDVLRNRAYVGFLLTAVGAFGALFAYISASPFVVQDVLGLSPAAYGLVFGANAAGLVLAGATCVRLAGRVSPRRLLSLGVGCLCLTTLVQLVNVLWWGTPAFTLVLMGLSTTSLGLVFGNASALALGSVTRSRGTASAFLGACQFSVGAAVSPLVGLAGKHSAWPMALVMFVAACLSATALRWVAPRHVR